MVTDDDRGSRDPGSKQSRARRIEPIPEATERAATQVIDAAYSVHRALGPGLLESIYEACLVRELAKRRLAFRRQVEVPVIYDGVKLEAGLRLDLVVEGSVVVELKATDAILPLHKAQLLSYLRLSGHRLGLLINFNVPVIKDGIRRIAL